MGVPIGMVERISAFMELDASDFGIHAYDGSTPERLCRRYVNLIEALEDEGYEPDVDEREMYADAYRVVFGTEA